MVEQYFGWPMLVLMLLVNFIVLLIRRGAEGKFPQLKKDKTWEDIVLPVLPVFIGVTFAMKYLNWPFPEAFALYPLRQCLGATVGFTAALGYKILKSIVKRTWGVELPDDTDADPPTPRVPPAPPAPPPETVSK